jgi:hypothetical protein
MKQKIKKTLFRLWSKEGGRKYVAGMGQKENGDLSAGGITWEIEIDKFQK